MNFDETTPVQELTIPVILEGKRHHRLHRPEPVNGGVWFAVINELSKGCHPTGAVNCGQCGTDPELAQQIDPTNSRIHLFYTFRIRSSSVWRYRRIAWEQQKRFRDGCGYRDPATPDVYCPIFS